MPIFLCNSFYIFPLKTQKIQLFAYTIIENFENTNTNFRKGEFEKFLNTPFAFTNVFQQDEYQKNELQTFAYSVYSTKKYTYNFFGPVKQKLILEK